MNIYQVETVNGRFFRIAINSDAQKKRMMKVINNSQDKYERFINLKCINNGVHNIKDFESISGELV